MLAGTVVAKRLIRPHNSNRLLNTIRNLIAKHEVQLSDVKELYDMPFVSRVYDTLIGTTNIRNNKKTFILPVLKYYPAAKY